MKRRAVWATLCMFGAVVGPLDAQTSEPAGAGPEGRVTFFAGDWTFKGTLDGVKFGPDQPTNRVTEHCEMVGAHFLTCRYEVKRSATSLKGLGVFGFDKANHSYFFQSYDTEGAIERWSAQVDGSEWTLLHVSGKARTKWKELSPTSYHIMIEAMQADGTWKAVMEGTYKK